MSYIKRSKAAIPYAYNMEAAAAKPICESLQRCPECGTVMLLARVTPAFWALPELHTFRCPRCGNVITCEINTGSIQH